MAQAISPDYGQQFLFPPALEDWVEADHPARYLREFVDGLDLGAMGFEMPTSSEGRPPYAPSLLLKIWLYGYYHRIRSTRKLEAACREHLSLLWLTGLIQPDHNSLWRFWNANRKAVRELFKKTVQVALHTGCVGLALQALDGTKIEAAASGYSGWTKEHMQKVLVALDASIDQVELKIVAENAESEKSGYRLPAGMADRKALREQIKAGLAQLEADQRKHYHPVEREARRMKVGKTNRFAYNAQAVADGQEGIIVAAEATRQETDVAQLVPMIEQARENLGPTGLTTMTVVDAGYTAGKDLQEASTEQMPVLGPPLEGKVKKDKPYHAHRFVYDPRDQSVTCPQGVQLDHEGQTTKKGQAVQRYRCHCRDCPVRTQCTKDPKGRQVEIWPYAAVTQQMRRRLEQPAIYEIWSQRREIIERQFGQIKQHDGFRRWTVWGLESVKAQWLMICTTLNLRVLYRRWRVTRGPVSKNNTLTAVPLPKVGFCVRKIHRLGLSTHLGSPIAFST